MGEGDFPKSSDDILYASEVNNLYGQYYMYAPLIQSYLDGDISPFNAYKDTMADDTTYVTSHTGLTYDSSYDSYYIDGTGDGTYISKTKEFVSQTIKSGIMWLNPVLLIRDESVYPCNEGSVSGDFTDYDPYGLSPAVTAGADYYQVDDKTATGKNISGTYSDQRDYKTATKNVFIDFSGWMTLADNFNYNYMQVGFTDGTSFVSVWSKRAIDGNGFPEEKHYFYIDITHEKAYLDNCGSSATSYDISSLSNWYLCFCIYGKDSSAPDQIIIRFKLIRDDMDITAPSNSDLALYLSADGGSNYTSVENGNRTKITNTGKSCIMKFSFSGVVDTKTQLLKDHGGIGSFWFPE